MKAIFVITALAFALVIGADNTHHSRSLHLRHAKNLQRLPVLTTKSTIRRKTCTPPLFGNKTTFDPSTKASHPTSASKSAQKSPSTSSNHLISVKSDCGPIGATQKTTHLSGPNGSIDWLNCGLTSGGWNPPHVEMKDLVVVPLQAAVDSGKGPFMVCRNYIHLFERYGQKYGIPSIMLASFAMQESSCNPNTVGGAGEQGLMQVTKDKCGGAPGGNCRDPDFNIHTGARYFSQTLDRVNGNVIEAVALYNGWKKGLTYAQATSAAKTDCCRCQNNCDYLQQFFNGWLQNINAYDSSYRLGKYFNLDACH